MKNLLEGTFDADGVATAPRSGGAYRLWRYGRVLYVGMASGPRTLRSELERHRRGDFGPRTQCASHFDCVPALDAGQAHEHYLRLHMSSGLRPLC